MPADVGDVFTSKAPLKITPESFALGVSIIIFLSINLKRENRSRKRRQGNERIEDKLISDNSGNTFLEKQRISNNCFKIYKNKTQKRKFT